MSNTNFYVLRVMTIKTIIWRIVMLWGLIDIYWYFWEQFYLRGVFTFLPCLELNFKHTTAQKAVFFKLLTKSLAQGFPWKNEGTLFFQLFTCFFACTNTKFTKVTSGSKPKLKETILHHRCVLSFNICFLFTNSFLPFRFPGLNVYEFWITPIHVMSSALPFNHSAWSDGHCPHAARSHSFVYISTS